MASWNICSTGVRSWDWSVCVSIDGCRWLLCVVHNCIMVSQLSCMIFAKGSC